MNNNKKKIIISKDGPYLVSGNIPLCKEVIVKDQDGLPLSWEKSEKFPDEENYALCRCGKSKNKPYCDGTHSKIVFDGTETANCKLLTENIIGPGLILKDAVSLCAIAKFCHRAGDTWTLIEKSDDPKAKEIAIEEACNCPSGRLVVIDKASGEPIEPDFEPSISVVEIPDEKLSGPLWAKGHIPVESSNGTPYEVRNRVTLCRCGRSHNKPFCDGTHIITA